MSRIKAAMERITGPNASRTLAQMPIKDLPSSFTTEVRERTGGRIAFADLLVVVDIMYCHDSGAELVDAHMPDVMSLMRKRTAKTLEGEGLTCDDSDVQDMESVSVSSMVDRPVEMTPRAGDEFVAMIENGVDAESPIETGQRAFERLIDRQDDDKTLSPGMTVLARVAALETLLTDVMKNSDERYDRAVKTFNDVRALQEAVGRIENILGTQ